MHGVQLGTLYYSVILDHIICFFKTGNCVCKCNKYNGLRSKTLTLCS